MKCSNEPPGLSRWGTAIPNPPGQARWLVSAIPYRTTTTIGVFSTFPAASSAPATIFTSPGGTW